MTLLSAGGGWRGLTGFDKPLVLRAKKTQIVLSQASLTLEKSCTSLGTAQS